jgi:hypothetical protein
VPGYIDRVTDASLRVEVAQRALDHLLGEVVAAAGRLDGRHVRSADLTAWHDALEQTVAALSDASDDLLTALRLHRGEGGQEEP